MKQTITPVRSLKREVTVPGDRRISLCRAVVAAISEGPTELIGYAPGPECMAMLEALGALGVPIEGDGDTVRIHGVGLRGLRKPKGELHCDSLAGLGLLCGLLAGPGWDSTLTGSDALDSVPSFIDPLRSMGAQITCAEDARPSLHLSSSALKGVRYEMATKDWVVKSALLLAALYADGETTLIEEGEHSIDHLERALKHAGAPTQKKVLRTVMRRSPDDFEAELKRRLKKQEEGSKPPPRCEIKLSGSPSLQGRDMTVPGDLSLASFFIVAAAVVPYAEVVIRNVVLNTTRCGIVETLKCMGADITTERVTKEGEEPVGDLVVHRAELRGTKVAGDIALNMLDEIPALAIAATQASGETLIRDVGALRKGKVDRLSALATNLKNMGAKVGELPDGLIIEGGRPLDGIDVDSFGDPHIAMAFAVAGLVAYGKTIIDGAECVDAIFPGFFEQLVV